MVTLQGSKQKGEVPLLKSHLSVLSQGDGGLLQPGAIHAGMTLTARVLLERLGIPRFQACHGTMESGKCVLAMKWKKNFLSIF
jgi:hypothetical protein